MHPSSEETKAYPNRSLLPSSYLNGYIGMRYVHASDNGQPVGIQPDRAGMGEKVKL